MNSLEIWGAVAALLAPMALLWMANIRRAIENAIEDGKISGDEWRKIGVQVINWRSLWQGINIPGIIAQIIELLTKKRR